MAAYLQPPPQPGLAPEYDEWVARQSASLPERFKILFPHDGDVFVLYPNQSGFSPEPQALEFRALVRRGDSISWWLNGRMLASQTQGTAFWPLRPGRWTLRAQSQNESNSVTFIVFAGVRVGKSTSDP
jgi:penicillin-binding protein 1C